MAGEAIQHLVLALRKIPILIAVLDEAIFNIQLRSGDVFMALPAQPRIAFNEHAYAFGIGGMQAARSMACFTAYTRFIPAARNSREVVLAASFTVTSGMAGATGE